MLRTAHEPYSLAVVPSPTVQGCYDWIVRAADGSVVVRSPYAYASRTGARLAGGCWRSAMAGGGATT